MLRQHIKAGESILGLVPDGCISLVEEAYSKKILWTLLVTLGELGQVTDGSDRNVDVQARREQQLWIALRSPSWSRRLPPVTQAGQAHREKLRVWNLHMPCLELANALPISWTHLLDYDSMSYHATMSLFLRPGSTISFHCGIWVGSFRAFAKQIHRWALEQAPPHWIILLASAWLGAGGQQCKCAHQAKIPCFSWHSFITWRNGDN